MVGTGSADLPTSRLSSERSTAELRPEILSVRAKLSLGRRAVAMGLQPPEAVPPSTLALPMQRPPCGAGWLAPSHSGDAAYALGAVSGRPHCSDIIGRSNGPCGPPTGSLTAPRPAFRATLLSLPRHNTPSCAAVKVVGRCGFDPLPRRDGIYSPAARATGFPCPFWSPRSELNRRSLPYQGSAVAAVLRGRNGGT